eukprot:6347001-Prymnesium_polylepis.1
MRRVFTLIGAGESDAVTRYSSDPAALRMVTRSSLIKTNPMQIRCESDANQGESDANQGESEANQGESEANQMRIKPNKFESRRI